MTIHPTPWRAACAAAGAVFALYVATLAPTTGFWDASEYIATAHTLGIPHPPGNPLFVALARSWELLLEPLRLPIAVRINLFAAATSAASAGFVYLIAHRLWSGSGGESGPRDHAHVAASLSVLVSATAFTVWHQSTLNEKVYTLSLVVLTGTVWLALRWYDRWDEVRAERLLLLALYLSVLGATSHMMSLLALPALAVFVGIVRPALFLSPRTLGAGAVLTVLGLSFNLFLPLRAAERPAINEGDPVCASIAGAILTSVTNGVIDRCPALASSLSREQYAKPPVTERQAPWSAQLAMYVQYFDWQWARGLDPSPLPSLPRGVATALAVLFGVLGLGVVHRAGVPQAGLIGTLVLTLTLGLVVYLNFRQGFSLAPDGVPGSAREVRERDYFFLAGFQLWGMLAGLGLAALWDGLASRIRSPRPALIAAPILLFALAPMVGNASWAARADDYAARDWGWDLLQSLPPYAILFTAGDNDTFPLWYLQEVEGVRRDVTVVVDAYLHTDWYPRQLVERTQPSARPLADLGELPSIFGSLPPPPSVPVSPLNGPELDAMRSGQLQLPLVVDASGLALEVASGAFLDRAERLVLHLIEANLGVRPIYFSSGVGMVRGLGLDPWAVREGLVVRLAFDTPTGPDPDGLFLLATGGGDEWFDYERSRRLAEEVYLYRGLRARGIWHDWATLNIPRYFEGLYYRLAEGARLSGAPEEEVDRYLAIGAEFGISAVGGLVNLAESRGADSR